MTAITNSSNLNWRSAFIGGTSQIGINALLGSLSYKVFIYVYALQGLSTQQATAKFFAITMCSVPMYFGLMTNIFGGFVGGYVSTKFSHGQPLKQSLAVSLFWIAFIVVTEVSPFNPWYLLITFSIFIASCIAGGYYAVKNSSFN
jgi:hypothetical protein